MKNKQKIIKILDENRKGKHIRELSRLIGTGLPNVKRYLDILEKEKIVKREKIGNIINSSLLYNNLLVPYLKQINTYKFIELPKNVQLAIQDFLDSLEQKPLISLIFGSYAKGSYTKNSDLDIFLVFQNVNNEKNIEETTKRISMRSNININPIYIEYLTFKSNFMDKNHSFSNEIRNNVIIINGVEYYYELIREFIK